MKVVAHNGKITVEMSLDERFEEFWQIFPKHEKKLLAKSKWDAITNGGLKTRIFDKDGGTYLRMTLRATAEEIIKGAKRYRASHIDPKRCMTNDFENTVLKEDGKYTCNPANWLNDGRWMDD